MTAILPETAFQAQQSEKLKAVGDQQKQNTENIGKLFDGQSAIREELAGVKQNVETFKKHVDECTKLKEKNLEEQQRTNKLLEQQMAKLDEKKNEEVSVMDLFGKLSMKGKVGLGVGGVALLAFVENVEAQAILSLLMKALGE